MVRTFLENLLKQQKAALQDAGLTVLSISAPDVFGSNKGQVVNVFSSAHKYSYWVYDIIPLRKYVFSFYAKKGTINDAKWSAYNRTSNQNIINPTSYFNLLNGAEWTRVSFAVVAPANCREIEFYLIRDSGVTGTMNFCYPQLNFDVLKPYI